MEEIEAKRREMRRNGSAIDGDLDEEEESDTAVSSNPYS